MSAAFYWVVSVGDYQREKSTTGVIRHGESLAGIEGQDYDVARARRQSEQAEASCRMLPKHLEILRVFLAGTVTDTLLVPPEKAMLRA